MQGRLQEHRAILITPAHGKVSCVVHKCYNVPVGQGKIYFRDTMQY